MVNINKKNLNRELIWVKFRVAGELPNLFLQNITFSSWDDIKVNVGSACIGWGL